MANWLSIIHVAAGAISLFSGIIPMVSVKGSSVHRQTGRIFSLSMTIVFLTAVPLSVYSSNFFLFSIAFFSQYMVFSGYRYPKWKNTNGFKWYDFTVMSFTVLISVLMISYALLLSYQKGNVSTAAILLIIFGLICLLFPVSDFNYFRKLNSSDNGSWLNRHFVRMISAYIAATTAFLVNNVIIISPLITWLSPSIIGTVVIIFTIRYYKAKA